MRQSVLVTGGAGYIGSHACKALHLAGYLPITYDHLERGNPEAVRWGPLEVGDVRDRRRLDDVLAAHRPTAIMHFAALADVGESMAHPGRYYANNVGGSITLLEAAREHDIHQFVLSSTCATYGEPTKIPIPDDHPQKPVNPYGASKLMVERILDDYDATHGVRSVALRYFNAAGADPDGDLGEQHEPESHLIPLVLDVAAGQRASITVFGDDFPTPDGTCVRDYVHVTDLARAHIQALEHLARGGGSLRCNLGTGTGSSVREVIAVVEHVTARPIRTEIGPRRPGDPPELVAGTGRAQEVLGWRPRRSDLTTIVADAWRRGAPEATGTGPAA